MSQPTMETGLDTFSTELHDNRQCRELLSQLNDFENMIFGPDFACDLAQFRPWTDSGCLLYSAVTGEAVAGQRRILSALSIFITTDEARECVFRGELSDFEMPPWSASDPSVPATLYLSSVISATPHHLSAMYGSLLRDAKKFRRDHGSNFRNGFAICTGTAGRRHMARSGFQQLEGVHYRGRYDMMVIDAQSAIAPFWSRLFDVETTSRPSRSRKNTRHSGFPKPFTAIPGNKSNGRHPSPTKA